MISEKNKGMLLKGLHGLLILGIVFLVGRMAVGCSSLNFNLPDRSVCTTPWEKRATCHADHECEGDQLCARRGTIEGRCTSIDCCDPWRNNGNHAMGNDWCKKDEPKETQHHQKVSEELPHP